MASSTTIAPSRTPLVGWLAVISVMVGIFSIVTTEILPIGVLTSIGATYQISDGAAGLMMTMPGLLAAFAAPTVTVSTARADRRSMLCALMLLLALANFLAAAAPAYWVMVVSRVLVGFVIGAFWSIGSGLAGRLVRPESTARATAVIFSAVPMGSVFGVPAGTFIADIAGWRAAFAVMGVLTLGVMAALVAFVPRLPAVEVTQLAALREMFSIPAVRVGVAVTFLIVIAHFGTYTYVTPFLEDVTKVGLGTVTAYLLVYGAAGVVGNFAAGTLAARNVRATFSLAACMIAGATLLLPVLGTGEIAAVLLLVMWGLAYGGVPVCSQMWFVASSPGATEAASVLFTSSFQASISIGALLGGVVVDATSTVTVMLVGGTTAVLMALTVWAFSSGNLAGMLKPT